MASPASAPIVTFAQGLLSQSDDGVYAFPPRLGMLLHAHLNRVCAEGPAGVGPLRELARLAVALRDRLRSPEAGRAMLAVLRAHPGARQLLRDAARRTARPDAASVTRLTGQERFAKTGPKQDAEAPPRTFKVTAFMNLGAIGPGARTLSPKHLKPTHPDRLSGRSKPPRRG